jgi:hypothetical protein
MTLPAQHPPPTFLRPRPDLGPHPTPQAPGAIKLAVKWVDSSVAVSAKLAPSGAAPTASKFYLIQRCVGRLCRFPANNTPYQRVEAKALSAADKAGTLEWRDSGLKYRETYCYRVMTCSSDKSCSAWSSQSMCGEAV